MSEFATERDRAAGLIFDWNEVNRKGRILPKNASFFDETLRDGLQNPSVVDPGIDEKLKILHLMDDLGIHVADIGLPGSSKRAFEDVLRLCKEVVDCKMRIRIACAGRTVVGDITPMIEVSQRAGLPIEVYAFIGSSPIRQYVEDWDVNLIAKRSTEAIDVAVKAGLAVAYVTEDTTRSRPEVLTTLFRAAIDHGASRLCLSDTVGHATPDGVRNLIQFTKNVIAGTGAEIGIDWHGHNDRGLALENAIWAYEYGPLDLTDLSKEAAATRTLYGLDDPKARSFGTKCLTARRLIERGVRFVQVYSDGEWDAHADLAGNHSGHCRATDAPIDGLLTDLRRRGLLDSTLVIWGGEFGRMPVSQGNNGRDHNPHGFLTWMTGAGIKGGTSHGETDEFGHKAVTDRVAVHDLHATMLHLLGIDHKKLTYTLNGRQFRLTDVAGNVLTRILA